MSQALWEVVAPSFRGSFRADSKHGVNAECPPTGRAQCATRRRPLFACTTLLSGRPGRLAPDNAINCFALLVPPHSRRSCDGGCPLRSMPPHSREPSTIVSFEPSHLAPETAMEGFRQLNPAPQSSGMSFALLPLVDVPPSTLGTFLAPLVGGVGWLDLFGGWGP